MATTYDPSLVKVSAFTFKITGFMKGTMITVKRNTEKWSFENGTQGDGVYIKSLDDSAIVELTLQATSPSNRDLSARYTLDKRTNQGKGAIAIEDLNSLATIFAGGEARILTCPDFERGDSLTPVVWKIHISKLSDEFHDGAIV